jgi:hypothetical protein
MDKNKNFKKVQRFIVRSINKIKSIRIIEHQFIRDNLKHIYIEINPTEAIIIQKL